MRGFVVVALGAILIWIGLSTDGSKVDAADVAEVRAGELEDGAAGEVEQDGDTLPARLARRAMLSTRARMRSHDAGRKIVGALSRSSALAKAFTI